MSIFFIFGCCTKPVHAAKNAQHVWQTVYDFDSNSIISQVITYTDGESIRWSPFKTEREDFEVKGLLAFANLIDDTTIYANAWPGVSGFSGTESDRSYAVFVTSKLSESFNTALMQIIKDNKYDMSDREALRDLGLSIAECAFSEEACYYGGDDNKWFKFTTPTDAEWNKEKISETIEKGNGDYSGASKANFRYLQTSASGDQKLLLPVSLPKGYEEGQKLVNIHRNMDASKQPTNVSWKHLIMMAEYNYQQYNITASNINELQEVSEIENIFATFILKIFDGFKSLLGLTSMEDLMLNRGVRDSMYYKGVVNHSWFSVANGIHWVSQIISVFAIVIGIVAALIKRNVAMINPNARASLKENLMDFFYAILLLIAFNLIFYGLLQLNYLLVDVLSAMTPPEATLTGTFGNKGLMVSAIIISFCVLFFELKMNITYLLRGITIIALYATAPLFIISLIYGKKGKELFATWVKELVGNIFMQTFHALIMVIFLTVVSKSPSSWIEKIIIIYSFLPLTQFFKDKFLGQTATDSASAQAAKGAGSVVSSGIGLAMMAGAAGIGALSGAGEGLRDIVQGKQEQIAGIGGDGVFANSAYNTKVSSGGSSNSASLLSTQSESPKVSSGDTLKDKINDAKVSLAEQYSAVRVSESEGAKRGMKAQSIMTGKKQEYQSTYDQGRFFKKAFGAAASGAMWVGAEAAQMGAQTIGADTGNIRVAQKIAGASAVGAFSGAVQESADGVIEDKSRDYEDLPPETQYVSDAQLLSAGVKDLDVIEIKDDKDDLHYYLAAEMSEEYANNKDFNESMNAFVNTNNANPDTPDIYKDGNKLAFIEISKDSLKKTEAGWQFDAVDTNAIFNFNGFAKSNNIKIDSKEQYAAKQERKAQMEQQAAERKRQNYLEQQKNRKGHTNK